MKIVGLQADNFMRLRAVEFAPDDNVVKLCGANGQGKTSILNAIEATLGGVDSKRIPQPVRDGELSARVVVDLDELKVTRTWRESGESNLVVETKDGMRIHKAQGALNAIVGKLAFDPFEFASFPPKKQLDTLMGLVELDFDPEALQQERTAAFDERTDVNRHARSLAAQLDAMTPPQPNLPEEERSAAQLFAQMEAADMAWDKLEKARERRDDLQQDMVIQRRTVADLRQQLQAAESELKRITTAVDDAIGLVNDWDLDGMPDRGALRSQFEELDATNRAIREGNQWRDLRSRIDLNTARADKLTATIEDCDRRKREGIARTKFPVPGLSFDDEGIFYDGIPFRQASAAEQRKVSLAMGMALNPKLRIMFIRDGSLLDSSTMKLVEEAAIAQDFQVWVELVDESGTQGIIIEDGALAPRA